MNIFKAMSIFIFISFFAIACGSSGGGDGSGNNGDNSNTATDLKISDTKAVPGTFITIEDSSIASDSDLDVTFSNSSGFNVVVETPLTDPGSARVATPLYINTENGNIESGEVTISIPNGKKAIIEIESLPDLSNVEAGNIVKKYLEYVLDNFNDASVGLARLDSEFDYDLEGLRSQIEIQSNTISQYLDEMNNSGRLTVDSMQAGVISLSESDLIQMDQLLFAAFVPMVDEVDLAPEHAASANLLERAGATSTQFDEAEFNKHIKNIKELSQKMDSLIYGGEEYKKVVKQQLEGISKLTSFQKSLLEKHGGTGADEYNSGLDKIDVASRLVLEGILSDLVKKMGKDKYGDPSRFFGDTQDVLVDILNDSLSASGSPVDANTIIALLNGRTSIDKELYRRLCRTGSITFEHLEYCAFKKKYQDKTIYPSVDVLWVSKRTVKAGESFHLIFYIGGGTAFTKTSEQNQVTIEWGDGESEPPEIWGGPYPEDRLPIGGSGKVYHSYDLDLSSDDRCEFMGGQTYKCIITVSVVGLKEPFKGSPKKKEIDILVIEEIGPLSLVILEEPASDLEIDQPGYWKIQVSGGYPPYKLDVDWDDSNSYSRDGFPKKFTLKGSHSYKTAGVYWLSFAVTDNNGTEVLKTDSIDVNADADCKTVSKLYYGKGTYILKQKAPNGTSIGPAGSVTCTDSPIYRFVLHDDGTFDLTIDTDMFAAWEDHTCRVPVVKSPADYTLTGTYSNGDLSLLYFIENRPGSTFTGEIIGDNLSGTFEYKQEYTRDATREHLFKFNVPKVCSLL